jgi:hypothetical protein
MTMMYLFTVWATAWAVDSVTVPAPAACESAFGLSFREAGLGPRGFLGANAGAFSDDESIARLAERGIIPWAQPLFVVRDVDEIYHQAFVHARMPDLLRAPVRDPAWLPSARAAKGAAWITAALDRAFFLTAQTSHPVRHNPLMSGLYVVAKGFSHAAANPPEQLAKIAPTLIDREIFEVDAESRLIPLDPAEVRARFANATIKVRDRADHSVPHLEVSGFFYPKHRARLTLSALAAAARPLDRTFSAEVAVYTDGVVIETRRYDAAIDDQPKVATVSGVIVNGRLIVTDFAAADGLPVDAKYPFALVREKLEEMGVTDVDLTKVWELHHLIDGRFEVGEKT